MQNQDVFFFCQDCDTLQPHTLVTERSNRTEANKNEFTSYCSQESENRKNKLIILDGRVKAKCYL